MPAIQTLLISYVTGGTDLGGESASSESMGSVRAESSATITFGTNGVVSFSQAGNDTSNSAPATNWNINGGTYVSYELLSQFGTGSFDIIESTMYGENRHLMSSGALNLSATALALLNEGSDSGEITIKLSVWDAATGGTRTAYGIYSVSASAYVTG